jgi:hypothetical protein
MIQRLKLSVPRATGLPPSVRARTDMTCGKCTDGWVCEEHPDKPWPHEDCAGPGMESPNPEFARGGQVIRRGRDSSMSCSHRQARRRHRKQAWSVRFAKRRTVQSRISSRSASCSSARLVGTDGTGTIRGRSAVDGLRTVSVALARERTANDVNRNELATDKSSRARVDVPGVQNDRRPRGEMRLRRGRLDPIAVCARSGNGTGLLRGLESGCGTERVQVTRSRRCWTFIEERH